MENSAQPYWWKYYWNFDIDYRRINSKQFKIFYVGNKYCTSIIYHVSSCDIRMLVRDDNPVWPNTKTRNFTILINKWRGMYFINFNFTISYERVFMTSEWSQQTCSGHPKEHQFSHRCRWTKKGVRSIGKVVWQGYFVLSWSHGTRSINMKPQNSSFKLCLSIIIIENN